MKLDRHDKEDEKKAKLFEDISNWLLKQNPNVQEEFVRQSFMLMLKKEESEVE